MPFYDAIKRRTEGTMEDVAKGTQDSIAEAAKRKLALETVANNSKNDNREYTDEYITMDPQTAHMDSNKGPRGKYLDQAKTPDWLANGAADKAADLSKTRYSDPTKAENGEEIYLTDEYEGVQPGNYTVEKRDEGIKEGSDPGTITGEHRIRTYLIAPDGTETLVNTDNKKASETWSLWENPLFIPSWFW